MAVMRILLAIFVMSLTGVSVWAKDCGASNERVLNKPNVILVLTDDQGWGDVGSHGNTTLDTPVMDRFAKEGARFDRFFVSPVCAPTRASLLTGRYHLRTGTNGVTRGRENMRTEEVTIAEILKANGYATGCFGKWHNGSNWPYHPNAQGFDEFIGFCAGHWNNYFDTTLERNGQAFQTQGYIADVLTDHAIEFIEKNRREPFFCYVAYNTPHSPYQVPDQYFDKYKAKGLDDALACVYGMCENLDDNLGRLLKRVDGLGLAEDTIVIYMTDNGPQFDRYNGRMRGRKGSEHEGGVRVPLFIRWPGKIEAGTTVEQIASHIDILPTLVEMCGLKFEATKPLDGISVAPLLEGKTAEWKDRMIFTFKFSREGERIVPGSVRTQQYRAVRAPKKGDDWELYDMAADPSQKKDIAAKHPDLVNRFKDAYEKTSLDVTKGGFDQPIHMGHHQWPVVMLPAHEAHLEKHGKKKGISYKGPYGWANDWITNWRDVAAYPWWDVTVVQGGQYRITLEYACRPEDVGARIKVQIGDRSIEAIVDKAHEAPVFPSPDRQKRGEVYGRSWRRLEVGIVELVKGQTRLAVQAVNKPGDQVMELKAVKVERLPDSGYTRIDRE
jgi:arylsulfatase A-like enzyme